MRIILFTYFLLISFKICAGQMGQSEAKRSVAGQSEVGQSEVVNSEVGQPFLWVDSGGVHHANFTVSGNQSPDLSSCKAELIGGTWAIKATCLKTMYQIFLGGKHRKLDGLQFEILRSKEDQDNRYRIRFPTTTKGRDKLYSTFNTLGLQKEYWHKLQVYMPRFMSKNDPVEISLGKEESEIERRIRQSEKSFATELLHMDLSAGYSPPLDPRKRVFYENDLTLNLFDNQNIYIRNISPLKLKDQSLSHFLERYKLQTVDFHALLDLLAKALIPLLLILLVFAHKQVRLTLLLGFLAPLGLATYYWLTHSADFFTFLDEARLQEVSREMQLVKDQMQRIIRKVDWESRKRLDPAIESLRAELANQKFDKKGESNYYKELSKAREEFWSKGLEERCEILHKMRIKKFRWQQTLNHWTELERKSLDLKIQKMNDHLCHGNEIVVDRAFSTLFSYNYPLHRLMMKIRYDHKAKLRAVHENGLFEYQGFQRRLKKEPIRQFFYNRARKENFLSADRILSSSVENAKANLQLIKMMGDAGMNMVRFDRFLNHPYGWYFFIGEGLQDNPKRTAWDTMRVGQDSWLILYRQHQRFFLSFLKQELVKNQWMSENSPYKICLAGRNKFLNYPLDQCAGLPMRTATLARNRELDLNQFYYSNENASVSLAFNMHGAPHYKMVVSKSLDSTLNNLERSKFLLVLILILVSLIPVIGSLYFSQNIVAAIAQLLDGVTKISSRDYSFRLAIQTRDEIASLGASFNKMIRSLQRSEELASFLSSSVKDEILVRETVAQRKEVSILFCGILNVEILERLESSALVNELILRCQELITSNQGFVDKFTGAALLSVFQGQNHKKDAVRAAMEMMKVLDQNKELSAARIGIGVASGPVVLGAIGGSKRSDFTCIGNTVNMAARLETLAKDSGSKLGLHIDKDSFEALEESWQIHFLKKKMAIKGKKEVQEIYEFQYS